VPEQALQHVSPRNARGASREKWRLGRAQDSKPHRPKSGTIETAMLTVTARPAARTPADPFTAQNHGVGRVSMALAICMPVGKPIP
jgi:hypothetical protein